MPSKGSFPCIKRSTGTGVEGTFRTMGCICHGFDLPLDFLASAEAWIDDIRAFELLQGICVGVEPINLAQRYSIPLDTQPVKILFYLTIVIFPDPGRIDVLEAQQETSVIFPSEIVGKFRRVDMAKVQVASGGRGKASQHLGILRFPNPCIKFQKRISIIFKCKLLAFI